MSKIEESIDVMVPVHTAYNQWTQFEEFPKFMEGVKKVRQLDANHLHWEAKIGLKEEIVSRGHFSRIDSPYGPLTDEERARCEQLMMHPAARFPWLTLDEMRRLLWYREYFGQREHERPT